MTSYLLLTINNQIGAIECMPVTIKSCTFLYYDYLQFCNINGIQLHRVSRTMTYYHTLYIVRYLAISVTRLICTHRPSAVRAFVSSRRTTVDVTNDMDNTTQNKVLLESALFPIITSQSKSNQN